MTKLERLYELALNENIEIRFFNLKEIGLLGLNVSKENMPHMIFLDISIKSDVRLHTNILAHELGHYFTSLGNSINSNSYVGKILNNKCENKADKWAYEFLITEDELVDAFNAYPTSIEDVCEYLDVDLETLIKRLEFLSKKNTVLDLGNNRLLSLAGLPNIYIHDGFFSL